MAEENTMGMRVLPSWVKLAVKLVATATVLLYMYSAVFGQLQAMMQRGIIISVCMAIVFLLYPPYRKAPRWFLAIDLLFIAITIGSISVFIDSWFEYIRLGSFKLQSWQFPIALAYTLLALEASRRIMGPVMTIIVSIALVYGFTSASWPGFFRAFSFRPIQVMEFVALSTEGLFGIIAQIAATMIIMFMVFASFLKFSGASQFFFDFPLALFGRVRGGPAKVAVVGSGLFGMFSGSATANVVATGTFTIPMMKNVGYKPADAGAIEACASTGGQLMPPVMGAAAFIIAENLQVRYWNVIVAAFIPAVIYYVGLFSIVDIKALKSGLKGIPRAELPNAWKVLKRHGYLIIPVVVLIYLLGVRQWGPMLASFWATVSVFALSWLRRETRMGPGRVVDACEDSIKNSLGVVLVCAIAGVIVGILALTGLGHKLSLSLFDISRGNMYVLLVLAALVSYVLGMAITTTGIYILVATLVAPALTKIGITPMAAHLGVFYFAMMCTITPPVAPAVYAAVGLANEGFWKIGWSSVRMGLILFILPFVFIFEPALILQGELGDILATVVSVLLGVVALTFVLEGSTYWATARGLTRLLFLIAAVLLFIPGLASDVVGYGVLAAASLLHWREAKGQRASHTAAAPPRHS